MRNQPWLRTVKKKKKKNSEPILKQKTGGLERIMKM